jgi:23S rRNA pseudouridine2457 synthase
MHVIKFNKPYGVLSQFTSEEGKRTLAEFRMPKEVYSIGRLDADSEGLLLLTDDGILKHKLQDPKFGHTRTYLVQVEGIPDDVAMERLRKGVVVQGYNTLPAEVRVIEGEADIPPREKPIRERKSIPTAWIEITLREGKNRQVRRMTAAVGFPTLRLIRVAFGAITLQDLRPGTWKECAREEVEALVKLIAGSRR